ncbi:MAG: polymer-forming cytoskeletal protein [Haloarculaceae archaeon]
MARSTVTLAIVLVVVLAVVPGVAAAASRTGGTVVVGADETVGEDLQAFGGTVVVRGTVEGDVEATGGTVQILGRVGGDVDAAGGTLAVGEEARINGTLTAGGGTVTVAGTVGGDARLGGNVLLTDTATIDGSLRYDGEFTRESGATVGGTVTRDPDLDVGFGDGFSVPSGVFTVYGVVVALLLGALLLLAFPAFSGGVAESVAVEPLRTAAVGLLAVVVIPVALLVLAITIVGIPLSLAGFVAFALLVWVGTVYGRYAVGAWLLSLADYENRWASLALGVALVAFVRLLPVPFLGGFVRLVVFLLGFGALVGGLWDGYRARRESREEPAGESEPAPAEESGGEAA